MNSRFADSRSKLALLLGAAWLCAWPALAAAGVPDNAVVARVGAATVTAGEVREMTGGSAAAAAGALDRIVEGRLLYAEGVRRGIDREPDVAAKVRSFDEQVLIEQYVLWKYAAEVRVDTPLAAIPGHTDSAQSAGGHGAMLATARRLQLKVDALKRKGVPDESITFLAQVFQSANASGRPRGELVVARVGGLPITWAEVEESTRSVQGLEPPLQGMEALKFVGGIRAVAGLTALRAEAQAALPAFKAAYDLARERNRRSIVVRRLLEFAGPEAERLSEDQLKAYYAAHPERYPGSGSTLPYETVRDRVIRDAESDRLTALRVALIKRLRSENPVVIEQAALESIGP